MLNPAVADLNNLSEYETQVLTAIVNQKSEIFRFSMTKDVLFLRHYCIVALPLKLFQ